MRTPEGAEISLLIWEILRTADYLAEEGNKLSAPFGLTAARWQVMGAIAQQAATVADIARQLSQTRQGVQRLADELVREGFAAYSLNPRHVRAKLLNPTPRGAASYAELMDEQVKWTNALSVTTRLEDITVVREFLGTLRNRLKDAHIQE